MNEVLVIISRVLAIISMVSTLYCILVRIKNKVIKSKLVIVSSFVFIPLLIASMISNVLVIMCDFVKNSVIYSDMTHIILYFVMCGVVNFIIAICMYILAHYKVILTDDSIVISKAFKFKKIINLANVDKKKSEYIFDNSKSIFKNSVLLNHDEYVILFDKDGEKTKIGLNTFVYTGRNIEPFMYFVSYLKLLRKEIK